MIESGTLSDWDIDGDRKAHCLIGTDTKAAITSTVFTLSKNDHTWPVSLILHAKMTCRSSSDSDCSASSRSTVGASSSSIPVVQPIEAAETSKRIVGHTTPPARYRLNVISKVITASIEPDGYYLSYCHIRINNPLHKDMHNFQ